MSYAFVTTIMIYLLKKNLTWRLYMGLVKELRERKDLTEREESIRKYIFENPERLYDLSARELGEATFSSAAAVTRFCKKNRMQRLS